MGKNTHNRQKILIVDDSEMNRAILSDMLKDDYEIVEAADGLQAMKILQDIGVDISLVLLDIVMPNMDGFELLAVMNKYHWIEDIPVITISAENSPSYIERAYQLGVTDFINRPFDAMIVHHRVINTIMLYSKQRKLVDMVADQIYEKEKNSNLMILILSHIVEFHNGESGLHVLHINTLTELLLKALVRKTDRYNLTYSEISLITTASSLHDIGKLSIPGEILNKPGRLTNEEFEIMKTHSIAGADMLDNLPFNQHNSELVKTAYKICRWHHERYDGRGYPDGLKGEKIPISAQVVALADVYDALTSERVYKKAFSHEKAIEMIFNGECGAFNPILLECLSDISDSIRTELKVNSLDHRDQKAIHNMVEEMTHYDELSISERTLQLHERERAKYQFFASMSDEIQIEYTNEPPMLTISEQGAKRLNLGEIIMNPEDDKNFISVVGKNNVDTLFNLIKNSTPEHPSLQYECEININDKMRYHRFICRSLWSVEESAKYEGFVGKVIDIHEEHMRLTDLQLKASHDALTGLLNHDAASRYIKERLKNPPKGQYLMVMFDLDHFKMANDQYGHIFGNEVLQHTASKLSNSIRNNDIVARIGGDEFLIFMECQVEPDIIIERIFNSLCGTYNGFEISISMGVAKTNKAEEDYTLLLHQADQALYSVKRNGRNHYSFYNSSMKDILSVISDIDEADEND